MISGGVENLVKNHWFSTLYIPTNSILYPEALAAQYHLLPLAADQTRCLDELNREAPPCVLLAAP